MDILIGKPVKRPWDEPPRIVEEAEQDGPPPPAAEEVPSPPPEPGKKAEPMRNICGDRAIEWQFVLNMLAGPGKCLDFGPGGSALSFYAALKYDVTAIDLDDSEWHAFPGVKFIRADIFEVDLPRDNFDLVINCSTVEHVGLVGRYGVIEERVDGDLEAMALLRDLMKPGGLMLLTVPLGQDAVFAPLCRVYGAARLPRLLSGFAVEKEECYRKNARNAWVRCTREEAVSEATSVYSGDPAQNYYALGCFVLRKVA